MKLNYKRTVLIGFAFMSILCFWQFYDQVIPYLLENKFGLNTLTANSIMAVDNVLAIFMLPLFGAISDKTRTRLGKRTPYILFGTLASVTLLVILGIFNELSSFWGFIITLFALLFTMAVYRTPAVAYMPDVTPKPLRSKANAIINLVGYIGGIFATGLMMFMLKSEKAADGSSLYSKDQSFLPVFLIIAAFMLISVIIMVLTIKENKLLNETNIKDDDEQAQAGGGKLPRPVFKSLVLILLSVFLWFMAYNAVTTAFSRYCVEVWQTDLGTSSSYLLVATIAAIAAFVPLGADTSGSRFLEPDGTFPNHIPNPEDKTAMKSITDAVKESGADLGVIFDTDVDRAGCVDSEGNEINRNRLIALAAIIATEGRKNCTIVTDSVTSDGLKEFIEKDLGCKHYRFRRGYKNVIDKAVELCGEGLDCPLAIETSGHAALKENYFLDDGAYLITKIVIELGRGRDLNKTLAALKMPKEERECRLNITEEAFKVYGLRVIDELEAFVSSDPTTYKVADDNREGIRVSTPYGWFLLRLSVHDPVMPLNFESDEVGGTQKMVALIRPFFEKYSGLDVSAIK